MYEIATSLAVGAMILGVGTALFIATYRICRNTTARIQGSSISTDGSSVSTSE
jgi:hypothetical protein